MKNMKNHIGKLDEKYLYQNPEGDADFSEERNKAIIAETIRKTDAAYRAKDREHNDGIAERAAAAAAYLKSLDTGGKTSNINDYFGRRELARLRGEEVMHRIQDQLTTYGKDGKVIRRPN